ncbi:hypothetical protein GCM10010954_07910 [Halobacillus andaensis]|uniref:DUF881 domain-containing protein n=1 Tax=Halobacillus andaensis TaxID=1176239 RepID=A0A917AZ96_HALAA|nr:DUF881 domain-containing protein [Halobacillus andaensis]MBP2003580.1 uncharacterized protein YlxW (UPF0749 family) [Halobacillus andaensis]GGF11713.1 hypothetical protein GCM10010954_07910 [Halobacillus andaensis]
MKNKWSWVNGIIFLAIGFLVAIQMDSPRDHANEIEEYNGKDEWEVREGLIAEQEIQQGLLDSIKETDQTLSDYEEQGKRQQIRTLKSSIEKLEEELGLSEASGAGVTMTISPIFFENEDGADVYPSLSPLMLSHLINEMNTFGAKDIAVENERYTLITPIRNVNGETYMNNRPVPSLPLKIKAIAEDPEALKSYLDGSQIIQVLAIEDMDVEIQVNEEVTLPPYKDPLNLKDLTESTAEKAGES